MEVKELINKYDQICAARKPYEATWDEITELVVPTRQSFVSDDTYREPNAEIYDSTGIQSNEALAATLMNGLIDQSIKWFDMDFSVMENNYNEIARRILNARVGAMYESLGDPLTGFYTSMAELFIDLSAYGTSCLESAYYPGEGIRYRTIHLANVFINTDKSGNVDTVFVKQKMTARQAAQAWGEENLSEEMQKALKKNPFEKFLIVRCVMPEESYTTSKRTGFKYYSAYFEPDNSHMISEGGLKAFPYVVPRWTKLADRDYGISPAWNALPDIRMLQGISVDMLTASNKLADPTLLSTDDSTLLPLNSEAGELVYGGLDPITGRAKVQPLYTGSNPQVFEATIEKYREMVRKAFYNNSLLQQNRPQMTAEEVMTLRAEDFKFMAPNVNRVIQEALVPVLLRHYKLMEEHDMFPQLDQNIKKELKGIDLSPRFKAPLARVRKMQDADALNRYIQGTLIPLMQMSPDAGDIINIDEALHEIADGFGVPLTVLRSRREVEEIRNARQQQQMQQQQAQMALEVDKLNVEKMKATKGKPDEVTGEEVL